MSKGPLPELVDHKKMARQEALIAGSVPVARFARLTEMLVNGDGEVQLTLEFAKDKPGSTIVKGSAQTRVNLVCQNCLLPYVQTLQCSVSVIIVEDDQALQDLEMIEDGIVCAEKLIGTVAISEDELILSVPMVPRHQLGVCPLDVESPENVQKSVVFTEATTEKKKDSDNGAEQLDAEPSTYRPFAGLGEQIAGSKTPKKSES